MSEKTEKKTRKYIRSLFHKPGAVDKAVQNYVNKIETENRDLKLKFNSMVDHLRIINAEFKRIRQEQMDRMDSKVEKLEKQAEEINADKQRKEQGSEITTAS